MDPTQQSMDCYYVMKEGDILGPYRRAELEAGLADGRFTAGTFVQLDGYPIWQPLGRVLEGAAEEGTGANAPDWATILTWAWRRVRYHMDEQSERAGAVCLALGTAALLLSNWPFVFWVPCFVAATVAAVALLMRQRTSPALMILGGVVCIPLIFLVFGPHFNSRPERAGVVEVPATVAEPPAAVPVVAVKPSTPPPLLTPAKAPTPVAQIPPATPFPKPEIAIPALPPAAPTKPEFPPLPPAEGPQALPPAQTASGTEPPLAARVAGFFDRITGSGPQPETPHEAQQPMIASATTPAVPQSPPAPVPVGESADFVQGHSDCLALVKGREGSGSSFVCRQGDKTWLFTNIHVMADLTAPQFTRLDGVRIVPGAADAAAGHDIMRFQLSPPPAHALEAITDFTSNVAIGDDVLVLGNSGGGGVVTSLAGKLVGIGPDRIEVSAEFIPGNSGSPVVHVKSGKVIGIATYLTRRYDEFAKDSDKSGEKKSSGAGEPAVRRFAYRVDSVKTWEPVNWNVFRQEAEQMRQISQLTGDIFDFLAAIRKNATPHFSTQTLRFPADEWYRVISDKRVSPVDRRSATEGFLLALRGMAQNDVKMADARIHYSYFRDDLQEEREIRDELAKAFDSEARRVASPKDRY